MQLLTYILVVIVILAICYLGMAVGLIFRNKTITSCGRAARDFDGEPIRCAACGAKDESACRSKADEKASA